MSFRATHLLNVDEPLCRQRPQNFIERPVLTADLTRVTCDRCLRKRGKLERARNEKSNEMVKEGER